MLSRRLLNAGLTSDVMQLAGVASIAASIATWARAKRSGDAGHAERFGIFIGLWAPTFFALAEGLAAEEKSTS